MSLEIYSSFNNFTREAVYCWRDDNLCLIDENQYDLDVVEDLTSTKTQSFLIALTFYKFIYYEKETFLSPKAYCHPNPSITQFKADAIAATENYSLGCN